MTSRVAAAFILLFALAPPVAAQERSRFAWAPAHQAGARSMSDALAGAQAALYAKRILDAPDRKRAALCGGLRVGASFGATSLVKLVVHKVRPDGSNDHSFWSGHAANSMAMAGWDYRIGIPVSLGTGYLRIAGNKHWWLDVISGWGEGALTNLICRGNDGYGEKP